ncbi:Rieske 2Fe-2S domain-containing protein [Nocardia sp. R7R-8]|uniref:Rieske 2Fe-2S domain-containing protein n=1 Tax=Nocardia sp. R7R-8 TaxID=3459304 RepID=UPI00403DFB1A
MSTATPDAESYAALVDHEQGLIDRRIMSDPDIYKQELVRIFARAWVFMCHDTQIPDVGDYFKTYIGEDQVIVVRAKDRSVQVMLNTCPHRGNSVCRPDSGNTKAFMCAYHGWSFGLDGKLVGIPASKDLYDANFEREKWGLRKAAQVANHGGFIFATLDPEAPAFSDYLGAAGRHMLDSLVGDGNLEIIPGVIKHRVPCNWKMATENTNDFYHVGIAHVAAIKVMELPWESIHQISASVIFGDYGHIANSAADYGHGKASGAAGPVGHFNLFPNTVSFASLYPTVVVRHPKGPLETEMWYFHFVDKTLPDEERESVRLMSIRNLGPAGLIETEDAENWELSTKASVTPAMQSRPLNYQMSLGWGEIARDELPYAHLDGGSQVNEHYMRWYHRSWAEWMDADDWEALKRDHTRPGPETI